MKLALKSALLTAALAALILPATAQTATPTNNDGHGGVVGQRTDNEQDRIQQGVKDGSITPGEASQLRKQDAQLHKEVSNARAHNGGTLTPQERQRANKQMNHMSHEVNRDTHNAQHRR
jgi:hypothetical protein